MFDLVKFADDFEIKYWRSGKNVNDGWVAISCPFCEDTSNHGGYNLEDGYYSCWRCGYHSIPELVRKLLPFNSDYKLIIRQYSKNEISERIREKIKIDPDTQVSYPYGASVLNKVHKDYLAMRNFNPDWLTREYGLKGTNYLGDYKFRIIAPILHHETKKMVSYQGRDVTGKSSLRYKACSKDDEAYHHKFLLYNLHRAMGSSRVVIVEGITDVWRLGPGAVATFGTSFTPEQVRLVVQYFKRAFVLFDSDDPMSYGKGIKLASYLVSSGLEVEQVEIDKSDPANMTDDEAKYLMKELL